LFIDLEPTAMMTQRTFLAAVLLAAAALPALAEEENGAEEAEVRVVISGLDNPAGLAVQPGTGQLFISDSAAGRIVAFDPAKSGKPRVVVKGFPQDEYGKGPIYKLGPLGLAFVDENTLVVGGGEFKDGHELVRFYDVSSGKTLGVDDMLCSRGPIGPGDVSAMGEGNFYALAATKTAVYITSNGDDTKGWVLRIDLAGDEPGELEPFLATKEATEVDAPVGIAISQSGHIVVGQMGEVNVEGDSLYTVYDPENGELHVKAPTGLYDIAGLAFSPKTGQLYAVDFAWMDPAKGGLFRLEIDDDNNTLKAVKIASLERPTALAFTPDGALYVTLFGDNDDGTKTKRGKLVQVLGDL
jgi:DNA-binding beta-propeller fold protein YncE